MLITSARMACTFFVGLITGDYDQTLCSPPDEEPTSETEENEWENKANSRTTSVQFTGDIKTEPNTNVSFVNFINTKLSLKEKCLQNCNKLNPSHN